MIVTAYFDRAKDSVNGYFTLNVDGKEIFKRLPARSGQAGYTQTDWVRGKSPIPYGTHLLWLKPKDPGQLAGKTGIGEFYPISTAPSNPRLIEDREPRPVGVETPRKQRWDIGLHPENSYPGSAGCIVLLNDTPARLAMMRQLFTALRKLGQDLNYIQLVVL